MTKHPFNMVEVAVALAVAAIALVSLMALFPIGSEAGRDAMAETYAAEAADEMLHQLETYIRQDWDDHIGDFNNTPPTNLESDDHTFERDPNMPPTLLPSQNADDVFKLIRFINIDDTNEEYEENSEDILDFEAIAAIHYEQVDIPGESNQLPANIAIRLVMEVSWPARAAYDDRETREYVYEIFNK